jgi:pimeloyl-ACP methyl ester carboxylesterase
MAIQLRAEAIYFGRSRYGCSSPNSGVSSNSCFISSRIDGLTGKNYQHLGYKQVDILGHSMGGKQSFYTSGK